MIRRLGVGNRTQKIEGSTRQMTDSSGNALFADYLVYKPFGEIYSGNARDEKYLFMILVG
ncbi:MAG: hypothetical protein ACE5K0_05855 [Candidatus Methanofastidiosia archaeon]